MRRVSRPARKSGVAGPKSLGLQSQKGVAGALRRCYGVFLPKPASRARTIVCERFSTSSLAKMLVM